LPRQPLGTGGFGKTYLAEDLDKLGELCVIKQLVPKVREIWAVEKAKELFEREAQQLQKLGDRPDIPALLAYFEENNYLYLVEQYIEGRTLLDELNEKGRLNEAEIQALFLDLLEILKFIHQERVIHRDIKPENIIRPISEPFGKVLDKILQEDYRERYQSAQEVISALAKRRQFPRSLLVAIALVAIGLSGGIYLWHWGRRDREPNISVTIAPSEIFPPSSSDENNLDLNVGDIVRLSGAIALSKSPDSRTQIATVPEGSFLKVVQLESNSGWLSVEVCPTLKRNSPSAAIQGWIEWETLQEKDLGRRASELKNCPVVDFSP
jgi:serine/threonine protein kinase